MVIVTRSVLGATAEIWVLSTSMVLAPEQAAKLKLAG